MILTQGGCFRIRGSPRASSTPPWLQHSDMGTNWLEWARLSQELELLLLTLKKVRDIGGRGFENISSCFTIKQLDIKCLQSVLVTLFHPCCFKKHSFFCERLAGYPLVFLIQGLLCHLSIENRKRAAALHALSTVSEKASETATHSSPGIHPGTGGSGAVVCNRDGHGSFL